jgi:hypothetical protein
MGNLSLAACRIGDVVYNGQSLYKQCGKIRRQMYNSFTFARDHPHSGSLHSGGDGDGAGSRCELYKMNGAEML